jgi:GT2 family glycosyltransferase
MATTAVVIPTFNRCSTLLHGLSSLFDTLPPSHVVIVVDSGSFDGTYDAISSTFPQVILLRGNSSLWWAAATNRGIEKARELDCKYLLTYNDDNIATPGLFTHLSTAAEQNPNSIISAVCCYSDRPDIVFFAGRRHAKGTDRYFYVDHDTPLSQLGKGVRRVDMLHGMCTLFPMAVFETVGLFNEQAFPQVFADDDLLLRATQEGFVLQVALEAVVRNDRTKTGINPYDRRLGPIGILGLLVSRKSTFQLVARTRFLWRHRRSVGLFVKTWVFDYLRLFTVLMSRWLLPPKLFHRSGLHWVRRLQRR